MLKRIIFFPILVVILLLLKPAHTAAQNGQVFAAVKQDGKWGYIDTTGKTWIPFNMEDASSFSTGLAAVKYAGRWGYINKKGDFILKPVFTQAGWFLDDRARISYFDPRDSASYTGYIDKLGNMITVLENYEQGGEVHDGLIKILSTDVNGPAFGYKDTMDNWVIKPHYDAGTDFHEGKAAIALGKYWGFIDEHNNMVVFPKYDMAYYYQEGMAYVKLGKKISFINPEGKAVFTVDYDTVDLLLQDGMISFKQNGKMGFLNKKGKVAIKPQFTGNYLTRFKDGLAPVMGINGKYGYIDKSGKFVIEPQFEKADLFYNNLALVKSNGKFGYINRMGQWVIKPKYDAGLEFEHADNY